MHVKLSLLSLCFLWLTQETSGRKMNLNVELFALPEHFQETSSNLNKQLSGDLKFFLKKMEMFSTQDLEIVDYTLTILNKKDINYPYWSSPLDGAKVFDAMYESRKFQQSKANLKVLLVPSDSKLESQGGSVAGVARRASGDFLDRMNQYAIVKIDTFEYFVKENNLKKNSKLAEDSWAKRDDKEKMDNLGTLAHELGHLLGASECAEKSNGLKFDVTSVMCRNTGSRVSKFARSEIDCRVKNGELHNGRCYTLKDYGSRRG